jgi:hypothetical protein
MVILLCAAVTFSQELTDYNIGICLWRDKDQQGGEAYRFWPKLKEAGVKFIRIGGLAYDENPPSTTQIISWLDSIQKIGAQAMIQVSINQTPQQCAELVRKVNIEQKRKVKIWAIGNEPWIQKRDDYPNGNVPAKYVMDYWKPRATAMKLVDPTIKLAGIDECKWHEQLYDSLIGGSRDITGKDENGNYYIDIVNWHHYNYGSSPNTKTRDQLINDALILPNSFADACIARVNYANTKNNRTGANALQWMQSENNVTWKNPTDKSVYGVHTRSFIAGQYIARVYGAMMQKGALSSVHWSMYEGGSGDSTDFGMFDGAPNYYPRSWYYHVKMIGNYFSGTYLPATTNLQPYQAVIACKNSAKICVMIMNQNATANYQFTVGLNNAVSGTSALKVLVPAGVAKEYVSPVTIKAQSTVMLVFNTSGDLVERHTYSVTLNQNNQPPTVEKFVPVTLPGIVQAEDYNGGGEGVGYHDLTTGNAGNVYRTDNVDIQACTDVGGGYNVGWVQAGEWLAFNVTVAQPGSYTYTARVASGVVGTKTLKIQIDGADVIGGAASFTSSAGWDVWSDAVSGAFTLSAGSHQLRISMVTADLNLNKITFVQGNTPPSAMITAPVNGAVYPAPANINVSVTASDADGSVSQVALLQNAVPVGAIIIPPYSWSLTNLPAGTYTLKATATDNDGLTDDNVVTITVVAAPATPLLSAPVDNAANIATNPSLSWGAVAGAGAYRVQVSTDNAFASTIVDDATLTSATKTLSGLTKGTTYYWRVNAANAGGSSAFSTAWSFTVIPLQPPAAPVLATPANNSAGVVLTPTLSWNASPEALTYDLQVAATPGFETVLIDDPTLTSTSKTLAGLSYSTTYYWRVNATNALGAGLWSTVYGFTTAPQIQIVTVDLNPTKDAYVKGGANAAINYGTATILEAKTQASDANVNRQFFITFDLSGITGTVSAANLQLNRSAGLANVAMTVYQCADVTWSETAINWNTKPVLGASVVAVTLTATNGLYTFDVGTYVAARKAAGATAISFACVGAEQGPTAQQTFSSREGTNKPVLQVTYLSGPVIPVAPVLTSPANGTTNLVINPTLTWNAVSGATSYSVQVSAAVDFGTLIVNASTTSTTLSPSGLVNGATYYWRVSASNSVGTSAWSPVFSFTTIPALPAIPVLAAPIDGATAVATSPTLSWIAASGAATYRVQVSTVNTFATRVVDDSTLTAITKAVSGLTPVTNYYWRVNAKNAGGASDWSATWGFTTGQSQLATISLNPVKDAYVRGGTNAAVNYGALATVEVKTQSGDLTYSRNTYINFSLSGFSGSVSTASLQLFRSAGLANIVVTAYQCTDNVWSETAITWNNKPAVGASTATATMTATNGWYTFDVTAYVKARKAAGATAITFTLIGAEQGATSQQTFSSKEGANKPVLQIVYQTGLAREINSHPRIKVNYTLSMVDYRNGILSFTLPGASSYRISAYSLLGEKIREINEGNGMLGVNTVKVSVPPGVYILKLVSGNASVQREFTIVR